MFALLAVLPPAGAGDAVAYEKISGMSRDASLLVMVRDRIGRSPSQPRRQM